MSTFYIEKRVIPARKPAVNESPRTVRPRATAASAKPVTRSPRHKKAIVVTEAGVAEVAVSLESIARLAYSYWEAQGLSARTLAKTGCAPNVN